MNKLLLSILLAVFVVGGLSVQATVGQTDGKIVTFMFRQADNMFYQAGNETELNRLYSLVDEYLSEITDGIMPVHVNGYCVSSGSCEENLNTAAVRSNRVKSELITNKGLVEDNFITKNHAATYNGHKDVVTLFIPEEGKRKRAKPEMILEKQEVPANDDIKEPVSSRQEPENMVVATSPVENEGTQLPLEQADETAVTQTEKLRYIALKTNVAAWAGTIMNAAIDVQVAEHVTVELPVLWCPWHIGDRRSATVFALQPEARWWLTQPGEGHFFGLHAHAAWYNVRWKDDRYQDTGRPLLGAGLSYGYLLPLGSRWAGEFTLGAGYANTRYDTFYNIDNGTRIDTRTKSYWGITRIGVSLVYRFNTK